MKNAKRREHLEKLQDKVLTDKSELLDLFSDVSNRAQVVAQKSLIINLHKSVRITAWDSKGKLWKHGLIQSVKNSVCLPEKNIFVKNSTE